MSSETKLLNYWNLAIGKGSQDLLSNVFLKGCIIESEEKINFFIKDKDNKELSVSSISNDNSIERFFCASKASHQSIKNELSKNFKDLLNDERSNYELSSNGVAFSYTGAMGGEEDMQNAIDLGAEYSYENDSAQFNEVYEDSFDEEQKIIVAWSWTYNFKNESFRNDIKNQKLLDIYSEVTTNGWNTILEDELKTESKYNNMVYFRI